MTPFGAHNLVKKIFCSLINKLHNPIKPFKNEKKKTNPFIPHYLVYTVGITKEL